MLIKTPYWGHCHSVINKILKKELGIYKFRPGSVVSGFWIRFRNHLPLFRFGSQAAAAGTDTDDRIRRNGWIDLTNNFRWLSFMLIFWLRCRSRILIVEPFQRFLDWLSGDSSNRFLIPSSAWWWSCGIPFQVLSANQDFKYDKWFYNLIDFIRLNFHFWDIQCFLHMHTVTPCVDKLSFD